MGVRIRPLLAHEKQQMERSVWQTTDRTTLNYTGPDKPGQPASYLFNRVFPQASTSSSVYAEAAAGLVAASMQGYNSTLFAYGQTGSGKTYTMQVRMRQWWLWGGWRRMAHHACTILFGARLNREKCDQNSHRQLPL